MGTMLSFNVLSHLYRMHWIKLCWRTNGLIFIMLFLASTFAGSRVRHCIILQ